jgi:hypothetical protein
MIIQELLDTPRDAVREVLAFSPELAATVLGDRDDRVAALLDRLRATGDPAAALHAVVEAEDLARDVARVRWLVRHLSSPAQWLAGKVAERA